jgi:presenilin-like A22 family membrane protease
MALALGLTFFTASREKLFVEAQQVVSPDISLGPIIAYFFGAVAVIGLILFLIPVNKLKWVFRVLFALMFAWGVLIVLGLLLPMPAACAGAFVAGVAGLFWDGIWLHDLLLLVTLAGIGSVFGFLFSPLTFLIFMLIVAVYDVLAVRFGFMVWMADRLAASASMPAFVFPRKISDWKLRLKDLRISDLKKEAPAEREYSILGGGDIGFPLMLAVAVFFKSGLAGAVLVGVLALVGLISAFLIQLYWLKGKPMPALPPIAFFSLIGFVLASLYLSQG